MAIDTKQDSKHKDLEGLRIDRSASREMSSTPAWARNYILVGITVVVLLGIVALVYRFSGTTPEVEVVRASAESSGSGGIVLSATGYIVPHHKINVN
jgi:hypothetical protein